MRDSDIFTDQPLQPQGWEVSAKELREYGDNGVVVLEQAVEVSAKELRVASLPRVVRHAPREVSAKELRVDKLMRYAQVYAWGSIR